MLLVASCCLVCLLHAQVFGQHLDPVWTSEWRTEHKMKSSDSCLPRWLICHICCRWWGGSAQGLGFSSTCLWSRPSGSQEEVAFRTIRSPEGWISWTFLSGSFQKKNEKNQSLFSRFCAILKEINVRWLCKAIISFLWFSYPTRPGHQVLKTLNLTLPPCKTVAIVGESGGGNS